VTDVVDPGTAQPTADAGEWLRQGRERAGLSIDAVAQQLKLAPRQVKAIEDGNFAELPGRTFVRGFVRNYARLLKLDPEAVVAALPGAEAAPALEGPSIGSTTRPMGELPASGSTRGPSWSRWAIPTALAAAVIVAAVYEFARPPVDTARVESKGTVKPLPVEPVTLPPTAGTPLPNPVTAAESEARRPAGPASSVAPAAPVTLPAESAHAVPAATTPAAAATDEATLVIRYKRNAWTQVKDASGQTLLITNGTPGGSESVNGRPPFELTLGNAAETAIVWRGQPFDLAPHTRANIARVRLP
jgi:cytoskeleton protein RodZ